MVFSSISFLYYFLPIAIILYFLVPNKFKNLILLITSLGFYFYGEPKYIILMLGSIFIAYVFGMLMEKTKKQKTKKTLLAVSISINVFLLGFFKYADFFIENVNTIFSSNIGLLKLALPIGISFYMFQTISYLIDVYKQKVKAQKSFLKLATYISFFPQLIAGPIVRYETIESQLDERKHTTENFSNGVRRFILGLSKKVLLANNLAQFLEIFNNTQDKSTVFYWMYAICLCLYIYFDFSGYSDMAIGLGKIFGFYFPENFNYPYISKSITEFWRRWHISLGTWFKDYVYIPLGGSRVGNIKLIRNIFVVWALTGLWHGASWNFVVWGLYFAVFLIIEKVLLSDLLKKIPSVIQHIYVILVIAISFVIFNNTNFNQGIEIIKGIFGLTKDNFINPTTIYYIQSYFIIILISIIGATPGIKLLIENLRKKEKTKKIINLFEPVILSVLLLICTGYLVDNSFNPFLYFRF